MGIVKAKIEMEKHIMFFNTQIYILYIHFLKRKKIMI